MLWHRGRRFDVIVDARRGTIYCPVALPQVSARSPMWKQFREFVKIRQSADVVEHRRIDTKRAAVTCAIRGGNVSLTMTVADGDYEYGTRKFIHLIQEIYLGFLTEHFDYQVEAFGLDPDHP